MSAAKILKRYALITVACGLYALGFNWFFVPNRFTVGGFTGVAQIINHFLPMLPVGIVALVLNIPLFILGWRKIGRDLLISSLYATAVSSLMIDVLASLYTFPAMDPILACIYGGIVVGIGCGMLLHESATTGGTDFIAMYMAQKHDRDAFGTIFIFNAIMLAVAGYLFGWDKAMYSIIYQFTVTQALHVFYKNYQKHTLFIITEKPADVYECIRISTHHGATLFRGIGLYEQKERNMVYSVVSSSEMRRVLSEVRHVDEHAFINIIKTDVFAGRFHHRPTD